jgi:acyl-CoA thioesterase I
VRRGLMRGYASTMPNQLRLIAALLSLIPVLSLAACRALPLGADSAGPRPVTYVAIGASDAVGVGAISPETEGWVPTLYRQLPEGSRLVNLGVSGSLLRQAIDQQLPIALESDPDLVTVWLSVNDFNARVPLDRYARDLDTLLGSLQQGTDARLFVGNVPDVTNLPIYRHVDRNVLTTEIGAWNRVIAETAARNGATLVDLRESWRELTEHPEYIAADGFHPSSAGHRRLADVFLAALTATPGS